MGVYFVWELKLAIKKCNAQRYTERATARECSPKRIK